MTHETLRRAKELAYEMELLKADADNCQVFIDESDSDDYFVSLKVVIPKSILANVQKMIHKEITDQYAKLKQDFESL